MISNALWSDDGLAETLRDDGRSRRRRAPPRGSARLDSPGVLSNSLTAFWITLVALVGGTFVLALGVLALSGMLSFTADLTLAETAVVALVLGVVMAAQSPSVVVALRAELDADGPICRAGDRTGRAWRSSARSVASKHHE